MIDNHRKRLHEIEQLLLGLIKKAVELGVDHVVEFDPRFESCTKDKKPLEIEVRLYRTHAKHLPRAQGTVLTLAVSGCADLQEGLDKVRSIKMPSASTASETKRPSPPIGDTALRAVFADKPIERHPFPRVAVRLIDADKIETDPDPYQHNAVHAAMRGCWSFTATLWTDAKTSQVIGPFSFCEPEDDTMRGRMDQAFIFWPSMVVGLQPNTGSDFTDGPVPPSEPIPTSPYKAFYAKSLLAQNAMNIFAHEMQFDYSKADNRLWFIFPNKVDKR